MNKKYDIVVIIPTYNRKEKLLNLLNQIKQFKNNYQLLIIVINDGSNELYINNLENIIKISYFINNGKKKYWKLVNDYFKIIRNIDSKYFIILSDDLVLTDDFFTKSIFFYEKIDDNKKICLSLLTDDRVNRTNWSNFKSVDFGDYYLTNWNDLCYIAEKKFFENLNYEILPIDEDRWDKNPNLSSGVGQQITLRLKKFNMYHIKKSLVIHNGNDDSKMNKTERIKNPIITI